MLTSRSTALLEGAIDLHVHPRPSSRPRRADSRELAEDAARVGMRGLLLKDHDRSTVPDAWLAYGPGGEPGNTRPAAFGSICLNAPVGGLNPAAAEAAILSGARAVFLPTDSAAHDSRFWTARVGDAASRAAALGDEPRRFTSSIGALDDRGRPAEPLVEVVRMCARAGVLVCTGHLAADEVTVVVDLAAEHGARVSVTHAPVFTEAASDQLATWAQAGALLELCAVFCCDHHAIHESVRRSYAQEAALIDAIGADSFTLASDLGQQNTTPPVVGLATFVDGLLGEGIAPEDITRMVRVNPAHALGLE